MPWIDRPTQGFIAGTVTDAGGAALEGRTVRIRRTGWFRRTRKTTSDANGWFGMTKLAPGTYHVRLEDAHGNALPERVEVVVTAGSVARVPITVRESHGAPGLQPRGSAGPAIPRPFPPSVSRPS